MEGVRDIAARVDAYDIAIPEDMDRKKLLHDAKALKEHFEAGGGRGFWIFKPKAVKEYGSFLARVKVDGLDCANTGNLKKLIDYLTIEQRLAYIWSLWSGKADRHDGPFPLQVAEIEELHETLKNIVMLHDLREKAMERVKNVPGLSSPRWSEDASLYKHMEICRAVLAQLEFLEIKKELEKVEGRLSALLLPD